MNARLQWLRIYWPQWLPAALAALATVALLWGLAPLLVAFCAGVVGGCVFLFGAAVAMAADWGY